jgi:hypothetical protein
VRKNLYFISNLHRTCEWHKDNNQARNWKQGTFYRSMSDSSWNTLYKWRWNCRGLKKTALFHYSKKAPRYVKSDLRISCLGRGVKEGCVSHTNEIHYISMVFAVTVLTEDLLPPQGLKIFAWDPVVRFRTEPVKFGSATTTYWRARQSAQWRYISAVRRLCS